MTAFRHHPASGARRRGPPAYASAWQFFRDGKVRAALAAAPNVDIGPTNAFTYTQLDTDSRHARNLALAYAVTGSTSYAAKARDFVVAWAKDNHPASYAFTGDYQGGYHQSFGAFSFAFAYDLTRDASVYSADDQTTVKAWFRTWASVMKGYQDNFAEDYWFTHTGRHSTTGRERSSPTTRPTSTRAPTQPPRRPWHGWRPRS